MDINIGSEAQLERIGGNNGSRGGGCDRRTILTRTGPARRLKKCNSI